MFPQGPSRAKEKKTKSRHSSTSARNTHSSSHTHSSSQTHTGTKHHGQEMQKQPRFSCAISMEKEAEPIEYYLNRGFCPMSIGQVISDREHGYKIVAKLGYGGFSTVWLAVGCSSTNQGEWFAIKVISSIVSGDRITREIYLLKNLHERGANVVEYQGNFEVVGPDGKTHVCLVTGLAGLSVATYLYSNTLDVEERRLLCLKALSTLGKIHHVGVIHGDFTTDNVLLRLCDISDMPEQEMYEWIGLPRSCEVEDKAPSEPRPLNLPRELYASASLDDLTDVKSMKLLAIDFGQAHPKNRPGKSVTPPKYAAPEIVAGQNSSEKSDIWCLGVLICEILIGAGPFEDPVEDPQEKFFVDYRDSASRLERLRKICCWSEYLNTAQQGNLAVLLAKIFVKDPNKRPGLKYIKEKLEEM